MNARQGPFGLTSDLKTQLLAKLSTRRPATGASGPVTTPAAERVKSMLPLGDPKARADFAMMRKAADFLQIDNPYFRVHAGLAGSDTVIEGSNYANYVSYNYLGLNGHPAVSVAAKAAIDRYGTSVSASRIVSGERPVHGELERALADVYEAEDCVAMVSGHATNVTVIGHLMGPDDVIVHDSLSHNSIIQGALLSGATRMPFAHNDLDELDRVLRAVRPRAKRCLVIVEGHYSMDGDIPDLPRMIPIVRRHNAYLMVDEAHSLGVLGATGRGVAEHWGIDPNEVDLWMGTLSKTLSACGGYVAGSRDIIDYLRCSAPGFVYSVGMSPPVAAAALAALEVMRAEPERVTRLVSNATIFRDAAREAGLDTGPSIGAAIVPILTGSSIRAARAGDALYKRGINVQPILYPAVPERGARLRFFISSLHDPEELRATARITAEVMAGVKAEKISMADLAKKLL